ncbi:MAG: MotA/TolQ/ExbB proton channel family protein [Clostridia bacterium]|nr:MotA/TolQ/ExbB proton channel family protein [Clostridia bacterium]
MFDSLVGLYQQMGLLGSVITGCIIAFFIVGFYVNILVRRQYVALSEELAAYCAGEMSALDSEMLQWATDEYKNAYASGVENVNTSAIIETALEAYLKPCLTGEGFLKKVNGLLITTGLFGTFLGLTSAVGNIGGIMTRTSAETLMSEAGVNTFKVLVASFQGMSVAFITSLFGTGFSILLSLITTFIRAQKSKKLFITQFEEYLDIKTAAEIKEQLVKQQSEKKDNISLISESLGQSITTFNETLGSFTGELSTLKGFNKEFSANLQRVDQSAEILCKSFDKTSETMYQSGLRIFSCSEELNKLVEEIRTENKRMEGMSGLLRELSKQLDHSVTDRQLFLKAVNEIPDRLLNYSEAAAARIERGR